MLEIIKSFFSPVGGGRTSFASQNGNIQRKEDLRQGKNLISNSDFNRKRGEEYLKSSYGRFADGSNASVSISSSFASENIVGGGSYARLTKSTQAVALIKEVKAITLA